MTDLMVIYLQWLVCFLDVILVITVYCLSVNLFYILPENYNDVKKLYIYAAAIEHLPRTSTYYQQRMW